MCWMDWQEILQVIVISSKQALIHPENVFYNKGPEGLLL